MNKHYYSLNDYLRERFGQKVYKLSLNGGMTCPNRDGKISEKGCIFCSPGGSGDFAQSSRLSITDQIELAKNSVKNKFKGDKFIAYFQAYTNTYADVAYLEKIFTQAIYHPDIVALSIATRPDCLPDSVLDLLQKLNSIKPVWVELGLQTIHRSTALLINRGYELSCFDMAVERLNQIGVDVIVHLILGLPYETKNMIFKSVEYICKKDISGIKLQMLHVLKNTLLYDMYQRGDFEILSMKDYIDILIGCIERIPKNIVIHRITGDGPKSILVHPMWSANKKVVLNTINNELDLRKISQGSKCN